MMGRQLTVELTRADGEMVQRMSMALAGLIERPTTPKFYIGARNPLRTRQKMLEVE